MKRQAPQQDARGRTVLPPQRGPYNYGDGRAAAPGIANRPRTLEEYLRNQRQQQQQSQNRPFARPAQAPTSSTTKAAQPQTRPASLKPHQLSEISLDQVSDRHMLSRLDTRTLQTKMEERRSLNPRRLNKNSNKLKAREKERFRPLSEESPMGAAAETAAYSDAFTVVAQRKDNYIELFRRSATHRRRRALSWRGAHLSSRKFLDRPARDE